MDKNVRGNNNPTKFKFILAIFVIAFAALALPNLLSSLNRNLLNSRLLNVIRHPSVDEIGKISSIAATNCQALWLSHAVAYVDLQRAENILNYARNCNNREGYYFWAGEIALRRGNFDNAKSFWGKLKPNVLVTWGNNEYYFGDKNKAKVILETVMESNNLSDLSEDQQSNLYDTLALLYKEAGDVQKSIVYFQTAWEKGGYQYPIAFELGSAYYDAGLFDEAINVLEKGLLKKKEDSFYSQLDFAYFMRLAECNTQLGNYQHAMEDLSIAENLINQERKNNTKEDVIKIQIERLENWKTYIKSIQ